MTISTVEAGRRLEARIGAFFEAHGYAVRCNEVREGRSGGRHEVDVLAETSDALATYRVAVECKAWQQPVEKEVIAKLQYVVGDLGLSKGIVVSLGGARSGAERTAADLGIDLWGPDELRRHLGEAVFAELEAGLDLPASPAEGGRVTATLGLGHPFRVPLADAGRTIRASGRGRLGRRGREELVWLGSIWMPAHSVRLTVAQPEVRRFKTRLRATEQENLYEALGGTCIGPVRTTWEEVAVDRQLALAPGVRDTKVHAALRRAVEGYERVSSPAARERHAAKLAELGIPGPCASLSIDATALVHLPLHVGILDLDGRQRALAVTGHTGQVSSKLSEVLTANLAVLRPLVR